MKSPAILSVVICVATLLASVSAAPAVDVVVDGRSRFQTIEGFGTCLVAWVEKMRALYRTEAFPRTYAEDVGCNILRVNIWGPVSKTPVEDWRDIRYQDFDVPKEQRAQIFVDFGQAIRKINPKVKIIGTVWSPPAWMKMNQKITGRESPSIRAGGYTRGERVATNRVDPKYFKHFAKWMVEYMKWHKANGVEFYAVSPGNEIQFSQRFESCVWSAADFAKIVGILGEMMDAEGFGDVKIFGPETMTGHDYQGGTPQYFEAVFADPLARKHFDVAATHGYTDGFTADMSANSSAKLWKFLAKHKLPLWMTEGGTGGHDWPVPLEKGIASAIHNAMVAGNCSAFVPWQITGGKPSQHDIMIMNDKTPKTFAAMHYFKFIPAGAMRIGAEPGYGEVKASAYLHPTDGTLTIVILNPGNQARTVSLSLADVGDVKTLGVYRTSAEERLEKLDPVTLNEGKATFDMPASSMVTLTTPR
jgi:glucuronoarabinoxylan endo-1,4-beta-xylanase